MESGQNVTTITVQFRLTEEIELFSSSKPWTRQV